MICKCNTEMVEIKVVSPEYDMFWCPNCGSLAYINHQFLNSPFHIKKTEEDISWQIPNEIVEHEKEKKELNKELEKLVDDQVQEL